MKKTLLAIIIIGLVLLVTGKIIMSFNNDDSDMFAKENLDNEMNNENADNVGTEIILKEYEDVKNIDIELGYYTIIIQEDNDIKNVQITLKKAKINSNGKDINKIECKNGNLTIYQKQERNWSLNRILNLKDEKGELLIKIPAKNELNNISINNGVGSIELSKIYSENLIINAGTSSVDLKGVDAIKCNISGGTGSINLNDISFDMIEIKSGTGSVFVNGDIRKNIDIETGTGSVKLELEGKEKDYSYDIESGLGKIEINQNSYKKSANINNSSSYCNIKIDTGTGSIIIKTN